MQTKRWLVTLGGCATIFIALATYKALEIKAAIAFGESFPEHSETVASVLSSRVEHTPYMQVIGEVLAPQQVEIRSETQGRVVQVGFQSGQRVEAGQLLLQQDIAQELAQLDSANARLKLAQSVFQRQQNLLKVRAVSQEQLDRASADLATIKAEIAGLKVTIGKRTLRAPFAGNTGIHQFEVGQFLLDNVLVTELVGEQKTLWVDFQVPQFYPALNKGTQVQVKRLLHQPLQQSQQQPADKQWLKANIIARSSQVNRSNRSFLYRAEFSNADLNTAVNSGVSVKIPVSATQTLVQVPATAVQQDHLGQFVFRLQADAASGAYRAERQEVEVLSKQGGFAILKRGLANQQLIASDGAFKLYPGLLVHAAPIEAPTTSPLLSQQKNTETDAMRGQL